MSIHLQELLTSAFVRWQPAAPQQVASSRRSVTLQWPQETFGFLHQHLLYRLERKDKVPPWVLEYSGSKTAKEIDNLGPSCPHKFRLRVILRATAAPRLAEMAVAHFGSEQAAYDVFGPKRNNTQATGSGASEDRIVKVDGGGDGGPPESDKGSSDDKESWHGGPTKPWLESCWSQESWVTTDAVGQSPASFCLAVRGGYTKQVQMMLEERPELLEMINTTNGYTPLATAALKGDVSMVKLLLSCGAEVDALSGNRRSALLVALLAGHAAVAEMLLDAGADLQTRDVVGLRAEHCAVDGGSLEALSVVMARGGDLRAVDGNGWTPLFRAVVGGASTQLIEELMRTGSDVNVADRAGLPLLAAARVMRDERGRRRLSALRVVDTAFPHEVASENYTRLTRKIRTLHTAIM